MANKLKHTQIEQMRQIDPRGLRIITGFVSMGLVHGCLANQEAALWYRDAQIVLAEHSEKEIPPNPPTRPNIPIGHIALEGGY
jgi:hypothetical protein